MPPNRTCLGGVKNPSNLEAEFCELGCKNGVATLSLKLPGGSEHPQQDFGAGHEKPVVEEEEETCTLGKMS